MSWFNILLSLRALLLFSLLPLFACAGKGTPTTKTQALSSSVSITGAPASIGMGANWQYMATVTGSSNQNVTWTVSGGGTIDASSGLYIAPNLVPNPSTVTITATSVANSMEIASTTVTIQATDPLGSVGSYLPLSSCGGSLPGGTCYQITVSCPGTSVITAYLKVLKPSGVPIGTVLFGVGTGGSGLYDDPNSSGYTFGRNVVQNVLSAGYNTVQVSFGQPFNPGQPNGWLQGPGGVRRLACRYATVADWIYHHPSVINSSVTASTSAPMCATGNAGGSGAIAYAVYEYGLNSEFAMVEPTTGPVMTRIDLGCSPCGPTATGPVCASTNLHPELCYETADAASIDAAYSSGTTTGAGACTNALNGSPGLNASAVFLSDSILYQGPTTVPIASTRMKQLLGDSDTSNAVPQGMIWQSLISPLPAQQCMVGVQQDMPNFQTAATQIASDLVTNCH